MQFTCSLMDTVGCIFEASIDFIGVTTVLLLALTSWLLYCNSSSGVDLILASAINHSHRSVYITTSAGNLKFESFNNFTILPISSWLITFFCFILCNNPTSPANSIPSSAPFPLSCRHLECNKPFLQHPVISGMPASSHIPPDPTRGSPSEILGFLWTVFFFKIWIVLRCTYFSVILRVLLSSSSLSTT